MDAIRSLCFLLIFAGAPLTSFAMTLSVSQSSGTLLVTWKADKNKEVPSSSDWIGLYNADQTNNARYLTYQYATGATEGSRTFTAPHIPGKYTFRYLSKNGYDSIASITFDIQPPPPTINFNATTPTNISVGGKVTLDWAVASSSGCTASGQWRGPKASMGVETVSPPSTVGTYNYILTCRNSAGVSASRTVPIKVSVSVPPPPISTPNLRLSVTPDVIFIGRPLTLAWWWDKKEQSCAGRVSATPANVNGNPGAAWVAPRVSEMRKTLVVTPTASSQFSNFRTIQYVLKCGSTEADASVFVTNPNRAVTHAIYVPKPTVVEGTQIDVKYLVRGNIALPAKDYLGLYTTTLSARGTYVPKDLVNWRYISPTNATNKSDHTGTLSIGTPGLKPGKYIVQYVQGPVGDIGGGGGVLTTVPPEVVTIRAKPQR